MRPLLRLSYRCTTRLLFCFRLNSFIASSSLKIYGPSDKRAVLERRLLWATAGRRGFGASRATAAAPLPRTQVAAKVPTAVQANPHNVEAARKQAEALQKQAEAIQKAQELREMLSNLQKIDDQGRRSSLLDTLCSAEDAFNLPVYSKAPGIASGQLTVDLLKHQVRIFFTPLEDAHVLDP